MKIQRYPYIFSMLFSALILLSSTSAWSAFISYSNESNWQIAAGSTVIEDFQSYTAGTQLASLPALGLGFDVLSGGGFPATYQHFANTTPYGRMHLGNFPNGINAINRYDDMSMYVLSGQIITALGFWNGDGQNAVMTAEIYDQSNNLLGTIGALKGTFAGFTSSVSIGRVVFLGNTGDGWNHIDGLQTNVISSAVPEPSTFLLMALGLLGVIYLKRKC